jgi:protein-tyrosine phosphatase
VRGDSLCQLTDRGQVSAREYGIRTVVDLRSKRELERDPNPFAGLPHEIAYRHRPLNDPSTEERIAALPKAAERYVVMIDAGGERIAQVLRAMAGAPVGGVLFHCYAGRDRTGIVAAILLRLAGVADEAIVKDFEATDERMQPRYDRWRAEFTPERRAGFESALAERGDPILAVLGHLDRAYGGVDAYLERHGFEASDRTRLRARLLT